MALKSIILATVGGASAYVLLRAVNAQQGTPGEARIIRVSEAPKVNRKADLIASGLGLLGAVLDGADDTPVFSLPRIFGGGDSLPDVTASHDAAPGVKRAGRNFGPLLALIRQNESGNDYDRWWAGISRSDYPAKRITQMTVNELLAHQDSIDRKYNSEAAGAYQFMEDTLRLLKNKGYIKGSTVFNRTAQDDLAIARMRQARQLDAFLAGQISDVKFADNLAKEWASFPAQIKDKRGRAASGQSYYADDGLNRSHTSKEKVLAAVRAI